MIMKRKLLIVTVALLLLCTMLASCAGDKAIIGIRITDGTLAREVTVGSTPDYSGVKAVVEYNDGELREVTGADLQFSTIDTSVAGTQKLTITYDGFSITVDITVKAAAPAGGEDTADDPFPYSVEAATLPQSLTKYLSKSFSENFQDKNGSYKVGTDNPFRFNLTLETWDEINNEPGDIITSYVSQSKVYLITAGGEQLLTGDDLAAYVTIDENNNTFQFTTAAIGKTFRLETRPAKGVDEADAALVARITKSLTVDVVDGYNVYNAKELNLLTNGDSDDITQWGQTVKSQSLLAAEFITNNNIYVPEGGIRGIVLHCDLSITVDDIPAGYLYTYTNGDNQEVKELYDHFSVFYRAVDEGKPNFGFYGNYFTINTAGLPCVAEAGHAGNLASDPSSSTEVFTFRVNRYEYNNYYNGVQYGKVLDYDYTDYHTYIENVFVTGDDPNSNDESIAARSMRGLTAFRAQLHVVDFYNVIVERHLTSLGCSGDTLEVNLNKCYFFNAWSSHIFAWNTNTVMNDLQIDNVAPGDWANYSPMKINITDSTIAKCGGPVIASAIATPDHPRNILSGSEITVKGNSELWTYVQGNEAWFAANNQTAVATGLIQMNGAISMSAQAYTMSASFTTAQENLSGEFVNLIYVNTSPRGSFTIENGASINPNEANAAAYIQGTQGKAPVFQSSAGGIGFYNGITDGSALPLSSFTGNPDNPVGNPAPTLFQGDYFSIFYGGNSIFVGYYH